MSIRNIPYANLFCIRCCRSFSNYVQATEKSRRSYEQSGPSDDCHTLSLVKEALSYIFGDVRNLYQSFQDGDGESSADSLARLAQCDAYSAFEGWTDIVGGLIFNSLRYSLDGLATDINLPASAMTAGHQKDSSESVAAEHVADEKSSPTTTKAIPVLLPGDPITWKEAHISHICVIAIFALVSEIKYQNLFDIMASRAAGQAYSQFDVDNPLSTAGALGILDALEYEPARSLTAQLILFFAKRKRVWEESRMMVQSPSDGRPIEFPLARMVVDHLVLLQQAEVRDTKQEIKKANACSIATAFVERLKTEILLRSDATPILDRWDVVGGAIELLSIFCKLKYQSPLVMLTHVR